MNHAGGQHAPREGLSLVRGTGNTVSRSQAALSMVLSNVHGHARAGETERKLWTRQPFGSVNKAENPESKESHYHAPQPAGFDVSKRRGKSERLQRSLTFLFGSETSGM